MHPLPKELRTQLEKTIVSAREIAETAARAAIVQLGVGEAQPYAHLSEPQRNLRRRLRLHGRQLGDGANGKPGTQQTARLIEQVAYEHWHRMLFARFLAENGLLMHTGYTPPLSVTLEECEELAAGEGAANGWELAARFAARMLPQIFRPDSPVFALTLAPEHQLALEALLAALPSATFRASDSLGWVYQFWQSKRKDEINKSEVKIGARELPAVTQLFTEPYMVAFLLDNALGAWWASQTLSADDLTTAPDEATLRARAALPGMPLDYLRFVRTSPPAPLQTGEGSEVWAPAAGTFDAWPDHLRDFKLLDPCCGSVHFLVAALHMLAPMRMVREGLDARAAVDAVLRDNLHGLEIDSRCVEIGAFALALAAWTYPGAGGYRPLPPLRVACSGLASGSSRAEWLAVAQAAADRMVREQLPALLPEAGKESIWHTQLKAGMGALYDLFEQAPLLGSLIDPTRMLGDLYQADYAQMRELLRQALAADETPGDEDYEVVVAAQGMVDAAELLAARYHLVITNPPYLTRGKQDDILRDFADVTAPDAKNDLATLFLDRGLGACARGGVVSMVLPQNWLFLTSYRKFRERLLHNETWKIVARLGPGGFVTPMFDYNIQLLTLGAQSPPVNATLAGVDVADLRGAAEKAAALRDVDLKCVAQAAQLKNPDARVVLESAHTTSLLKKIAAGLVGIQTGDFPLFGRYFWEVTLGPKWSFEATTPRYTGFQTGKHFVIMWDNFSGILAERQKTGESFVRGWKAFDRRGLLLSPMSSLAATLYFGELFDNNSATIIPSQTSALPAIWCYCSSPDYAAEVRKIDQSLKVTNATLVQVPFDLAHWTAVAAEKYPHGLPEPYSDDPTQWLFHGHPCGSVVWDETSKRLAHGPLRTDASVLQVAVARLLGYRWPAETDRTLALSAEARTWVDRCAPLLSLADKDGIVCLPPVRGEATAAERLHNLLAAAYGPAWSDETLRALLAAADAPGRDVAWWLREKFFAQHVALFQNRPFIWHIWDGLRDGFGALVNYHRLDRKGLEALIYTYLGDWITRQKDAIRSKADGAQERLAAAEALQKRLELILVGEAPYDIFVRWKALAQQPIGWAPDLNDGVRMNIRPFLAVPDVGKKGAGVMREKPNIKWEKDRGKDVASAPWFTLGLQYGGQEGDRINDHHLTLAEKKKAREAQK